MDEPPTDPPAEEEYVGICPECGEEIPLESISCQICGAQFDGEMPEPVGATPPESAAEMPHPDAGLSLSPDAELEMPEGSLPSAEGELEEAPVKQELPAEPPLEEVSADASLSLSPEAEPEEQHVGSLPPGVDDVEGEPPKDGIPFQVFFKKEEEDEEEQEEEEEEEEEQPPEPEPPGPLPESITVTIPVATTPAPARPGEEPLPPQPPAEDEPVPERPPVEEQNVPPVEPSEDETPPPVSGPPVEAADEEPGFVDKVVAHGEEQAPVEKAEPEVKEINCPQCDTIVHDDMDKCYVCGAPLKTETGEPARPEAEEIFCPECDSLIQDGQDNCPVCGATLKEGEPEPPEQTYEEGADGIIVNIPVYKPSPIKKDEPVVEEAAPGPAEPESAAAEEETGKPDTELRDEEPLEEEEKPPEGPPPEPVAEETEREPAPVYAAPADITEDPMQGVDRKEVMAGLPDWGIEPSDLDDEEAPRAGAAPVAAAPVKERSERERDWDVKGKFYEPNIRSMESFVVLVLLMAAIGFALEFTFLQVVWLENFFLYNIYLLIVTAAGIFVGMYLLIKTGADTPTKVFESKRKSLIGILGIVSGITAFIVLVLFGEEVPLIVLPVNVVIVYSLLAVVQMSPALSGKELSTLALGYTGVLLVLAIPVHEAFGPYQTGFANLPWALGNEVLLIAGLGMGAIALASVKSLKSFLAIWMYGMLVMFLVPFHETAGIMASGNYAPWDHTLALIGITTAVVGAFGFLARKAQYDMMARRLIAGNRAFDKGEYENALKLYDRAYDLARLSGTLMDYDLVWSSKANTLVKLGRSAEALSWYETSLRINDKDWVAWTNRGNCLVELGLVREGLESYDRALGENANHYDAWMAKAEVYVGKGDFEQADTCLIEAARSDPTAPEPWLERARLDGSLGKHREALAHLAEAGNLTPKDPKVWLEKAKLHRLAGDLKGARRALQEASELAPQNAGVIRFKAEMLYDQERYEDANQLLARLQTGDRDDLDVKLLEAKITIRLERPKVAITLLERLIEDYGERPDILYLQGLVEEILEKHDRAVETYRKAIKGSTAPAELSQVHTVLEYYNRLLADGSGNGFAGLGMIEGLLKLRRNKEALDWVDRALRSTPGNKELWDAKGEILLNVQRYSEAIHCFEESLGIDPADVKAWFKMGNALANINEIFRAIECYNEVLKINPGYRPALRNRSLCIRSSDINRRLDAY